MTVASISNASIVGVASAVPSRVNGIECISKLFGESEAQKLAKQTGVSSRRAVSPKTCTSDLCFAAAEILLKHLDWPRDSIDGLFFVSQSPDYFLPATSTVLHQRLKLSRNCAALDVNLGCSGWVYGLWLAANALSSGGLHKVLLLAGDTPSRALSPEDHSTFPLFGDAGTATALEFDPSAPPITFVLGTNGEGYPHIMIPAGAFRNPRSQKTGVRSMRDDGNVRCDEDLYMNGTEVFTFTLREVPPMISAALTHSGWTPADVDAFVFHQANRFILDHLVKKMKIPAERVPYSLNEYGNTSSASIPLTMTTTLSDELSFSAKKLILAGFGVGFSWATAAVECGPLVMPPLVELDDAQLQSQQAQPQIFPSIAMPSAVGEVPVF
jgi:3-oxoacyl-[acyl-carrier-protein] synthase III